MTINARYISRTAVSVMVMAWAMTFLLLVIAYSREGGQFGDMLGTVNSLFSGLAFTGLIITLILPKTDLGLLRDELE